MTSYAAFIGHQPHISLAELASSVDDFSLKDVLGGSVAIFETTSELDGAYFSTLGGTVVIAKGFDTPGLTGESVSSLLVDAMKDVKGKATFSLRTYGYDPKAIRELYRKGKDALKKAGKSARYVGSDNKPAPSVVLHDEGLLDGKNGCELVIIKNRETIWIGKTIAAQDIDAYARRDMQKPVRDTTAGLLPPKLAQILLNYGAWLVRHVKPGLDRRAHITIFDPFCGTGVIPIEALLRGWPVLASDVAAKAVTGTEKNLEWIRKEHKIGKREIASAVWKQDAMKAFSIDPKLKMTPDVIVTETMLGPSLMERPTMAEAKKLKSENEALQAGFLSNVAKSLPGVPLVVTWPVWYMKKGQVLVEKPWKTMEKLGYTAVLPEGIQTDVEGQPSLIYRRPDQFVGRQIVLLVPKKK